MKSFTTGKRHVGIQQGQADFPQGLGHVGFAQRAAAAELVENLRKLARQRVEHAARYSNTKRAVVRTLAARRTDDEAMWPGMGGEVKFLFHGGTS